METENIMTEIQNIKLIMNMQGKSIQKIRDQIDLINKKITAIEPVVYENSIDDNPTTSY